MTVSYALSGLLNEAAGPDRKRYSITADGVTDLERWLSEPEDPQPQLQMVLFTKVAAYADRQVTVRDGRTVSPAVMS